MRNLVLGIGLIGGQLCAQGLPPRTGNIFEMKPAVGDAQLEWVSQSTFRFARNWGPLRSAATRPANEAEIAVTVEDLGVRVRYHTRYLTVEIDKDAGRLDIKGNEGPLTVTTLRREGASVAMENTVSAAERLYGLGSRRTASLDLRGSVIEAKKPFLISSAGYGEYFRAPAPARFDLASSQPSRWRTTVQGDRVEYFFYYGPTPKEILEEHLGATGKVEDFGAAELAIRKPNAKSAGSGSWEELRETVYALQHESMSAMLVPSFDLSRYEGGGGPLLARAAQLAAFIPTVYASDAKSLSAMRGWRKRLIPYLVAYGYEARVRGAPLIHPLALQFPKDLAAAKRTDEFMVGDELLVAPVLGPVESVRVYLPQGIWTDLRTNEVYKGHQEITVRATPDQMPMFTRNGTILPLAAEAPGGPMELHCFPKLGAEFFLYEEDAANVTQVHAAPAAEFFRLEIESLTDRTYEWIVHHMPGCRKVVLGANELEKVEARTRLAPGRWYFDAATESLHVMVRAAAGGDEIVNISF